MTSVGIGTARRRVLGRSAVASLFVLLYMVVEAQFRPDWTKPKLQGDWMLDEHPVPSAFYDDSSNSCVVLSNGIVSRTWSISEGGLSCISLKNEQTGEEFVRSVRPEAVLTIDGHEVSVGGMSGQPDHSFLDLAWLKLMRPNPGFVLDAIRESNTVKRLEWKSFNDRFPNVRSQQAQWPPKGHRVIFDFRGLGKWETLSVEVAYEVYDGLPVIAKQVIVHNRGKLPIVVNRFVAETIAAVEPESGVDSQDLWRLPNITVTTDYTFAGMSLRASNKAVKWLADPLYTTQVNYDLKTPCLLEVSSPIGPAQVVPPRGQFKSFNVFELLHDSSDRERRGLEVRKVYRALAPWILENPIMLHLTSSDSQVVRTAIDQASECGFEMIVISFWSGLDMEDVSKVNLEKWKSLADYAHTKGIALGGYSLLASRTVGPETDVIDPKSGKPGGAIFGTSPCLCSQWGHDYFEKLKTFITATGFDLLEHDGSYPGDICASTTHSGHKGLEDSQWNQYQVIAEFYRWCRERGVFLNVPDNYHLAGSNKTGMGYRESNWSLPRAQQHIHARQNLFDGTWEKTPSMGWMMVPLTEYQGGGEAATIEPLKEHLPDYEAHLANNFAYGAQACYRGPRLFDCPETKAAVIKWVSWFKTYRQILEADVIHLGRADGRNIDGVLHVDPFGKTKGMLVLWNPTSTELEFERKVPFEMTGLSKSVRLKSDGHSETLVKLDGHGKGLLKLMVPASSMVWFEVH